MGKKVDPLDYKFDTAVMLNNRDILADMVEKGYKIDKVRDEYGSTALINLVSMRGRIREKDPKSIDAVIIRNKIWDLIYAGADASARDNNGATALLVSVLDNDPELLDVLLMHNPDLTTLYEDLSLFDIAVYKKYRKIINKLLEYANYEVLEEDGDYAEILNPQTNASFNKIRKFIEKQLSLIKQNDE